MDGEAIVKLYDYRMRRAIVIVLRSGGVGIIGQQQDRFPMPAYLATLPKSWRERGVELCLVTHRTNPYPSHMVGSRGGFNRIGSVTTARQGDMGFKTTAARQECVAFP